MKENKAIRVQHLSKKYQRATESGQIEDFFALEDVSFEVAKGDVLGIIGKNGSGKSTLLGIMSGIVKPNSGSIEINGVIASILEVGTGFHPDLSGRENIYLRGGLLGMSKQQIDNSFEEIVTFSEIKDFLDTPIKHYSSGMFLRLAFSIVLHLHCDILLLDEVISVGDIGFRKKCEDKIRELVKDKSITLIIVSHNIHEIIQLASTMLLLDAGKVIAQGDNNKVIQQYTQASFLATDISYRKGDPFRIKKTSLLNANQIEQATYGVDEPIQLKIDFEFLEENLNLGFVVSDMLGNQLMCSGTPYIQEKTEKGSYTLQWGFSSSIFNNGQFYISIMVYKKNQIIRRINKCISLEIEGHPSVVSMNTQFFPFHINSKNISLYDENN